jgi:hypothetical protein
MNRVECLKAAEQAVASRGANYGKPESNFRAVAGLWSTLFGVRVEPHQVALAMILLKVARANYDPTHADSFVDAAGYAACGIEVATEGNAADKVVSLARALTDSWQDDGA